jgi:phosphoribosyl-ATP pyrophosphohydrolase
MKKLCTTNYRKRSVSRSSAVRIDDAPSLFAQTGINVSAARDGAESDRRKLGTGRSVAACAAVLEELQRALEQVTAGNHPRTFRLLQSGRRKLARKLIEEACEVTVEAVKRDPSGVVRESADLLYHLVVLWFHMSVEPSEVWEEMQTRTDRLGLAEKRPKPSDLDGISIDSDG